MNFRRPFGAPPPPDPVIWYHPSLGITNLNERLPIFPIHGAIFPFHYHIYLAFAKHKPQKHPPGAKKYRPVKNFL